MAPPFLGARGCCILLLWRVGARLCGVGVRRLIMARGYRRVDRDQPLLLPPDMREWIPDDPVWLVIEIIEQHLDTSAFHAGRRLGGVGRAGYDPDVLLTLLVWGWMQGVFSSRRLERLCGRDLSFRVICAGDVPDHVTLARFRKGFAAALESLFAEVLVLCRRLVPRSPRRPPRMRTAPRRDCGRRRRPSSSGRRSGSRPGGRRGRPQPGMLPKTPRRMPGSATGWVMRWLRNRRPTATAPRRVRRVGGRRGRVGSRRRWRSWRRSGNRLRRRGWSRRRGARPGWTLRVAGRWMVVLRPGRRLYWLSRRWPRSAPRWSSGDSGGW